MDHKTRITPAKEEAVKALKDEFSQYTGYIFTDYRGMTVEQITRLRRTLMEKDAAFRVVKTGLLRSHLPIWIELLMTSLLDPPLSLW